MSKNFITIILLYLLCASNSVAQLEEDNGKMASKEFRPSIGLGMGMLNFFGDVNSNENHGSFHNQFGYTLHISRKINNAMDLGFSFLTGTIVGNERSVDRNLNFKTNIYSGSVYISYNFHHFIPNSSVLQPYFTVGFESFEYNNKADLVDANGSKYFYWTDGTIRNIDQQSPFSNQAVLMNRDYVYETDLRAENLDGLGKYPQISIGVPVGVGMTLNISDRVNFKIGSTFHFTFTDLIDNVSEKGIGVRQGNANSDFFIFNSISLHYDLINTPKKVNLEDFAFPDFFVLDMMDHDKDGVVDGLDFCPFTPIGVAVDQNGCPFDDDNDGVPNYLDKELATIDTSFVNSEGVTLTREDFYNKHLKYIDSLDIPIEVLYKIAGKPQKSATYRILLGEFSGRLPKDLAKEFLAEGDVFGALIKNGKTAYLAGKYSNLQDAKNRRKELLVKGMPQATIVVWEGNGFVTLRDWERDAKKQVDKLYKDEIINKGKLNGMYAIKLGNTSVDASVIDKVEFFEYEDLVVLDGDKNSKDYVIGPFIDSVCASQILREVERDQFPEATIVQVSDGKVTESGINTSAMIANENPKGASAWNRPKSEEAKRSEKLLSKLDNTFIIDFGLTNNPKTKALIEKIKTKANVVEVLDLKYGSTKVISKDPKTKADAEQEVAKLIAEGISTAKVSKVENGRIIPVKTIKLKGGSGDVNLNKQEGELVMDLGLNKDPKEQAVTEKEADTLNNKNTSEAKVAIVETGEIVAVKETVLDAPLAEALTKIEREFVVKLGTINEKTSAFDREKLINIPNTIKVENTDGTIDVVTELSHELEEAAHVDKASFKKKGFSEAKVAFVRNGKIEVLKKESLDGKFSLSLGSFKSNVPNKQVNEIASLSDVESMETFNPEVTTYTVGNFDTPEESQKRLEELISQGFNPKLIKYEDGKIKVIDIKTVFDKNSIEKLKDLGSPVGIVKTGGVVFRVQLGAYRAKINETVFRGVKTLAFPSEVGITKYVTGSFGTYQQSFIHKLEMKKLGFNGAFVVAYKDGNRILVTDLVNKEKFKQVKESVSPIEKQLNKVSEVSDKTINDDTEYSKKSISYRVQIGAFKDDTIQDKLSDFDNVTMEVYGQYKRYVSGYFTTYKAASTHKELVKSKGFGGAFVVAYDGSDRIAAPGDNPNVIKQIDLIDVVKPTENESEFDREKLMIFIQVGLYRGSLPDDVQALFNTLPNITKQITIHGVIRYMTGDFKNPSEAAAYKENLVKQGFEGAFLVAYYDNERIKIKEALEIYQGK